LAAIEIAQLHYAYPALWPGAAETPVLRGVDLAVERGEFLALMGPTGAGKTTLCLALNGLVPQTTGGVIRGTVRVLGQDPRRTPVAQLATRVGTVYQDPESQLFCPTVEEEVAFGPENLGLDPREIAARVSWALDLVEMTPSLHRAPTQLSGGQKQRVAIAATLAMHPEVLILDEPTSGLDPAGQFEVVAVIERLCRERQMTSHDAEQIATFADRVAVLWEGRIVAHAAPAQVFTDAALVQQVGFAVPQVSELAVALNQRQGSDYRFITLDEAERALSSALRGRIP
jgi:energy-coupling factor transporter ATP-binding protein EcfA2